MEAASPRYDGTSPKCFELFGGEGQGEIDLKSPNGLVCDSPYFDQLRPSLYSTWYNLYPH